MFTTVVYHPAAVSSTVLHSTVDSNQRAKWDECKCHGESNMSVWTIRILKPRVYNNDNKHVGHHRMRGCTFIWSSALGHIQGPSHRWQLGPFTDYPQTVPRQPPPPECKNKDRNIHNNEPEPGLSPPPPPPSWLKCETSATVLTPGAATTTTKQSKAKSSRNKRGAAFFQHIRVQVAHYEGGQWRRRWGWEQEEFPAKCAIK